MALLDRDEIDHRLSELGGWALEGASIVKQFKRGDFTGAVGLVDAIVPVANEMNHHPDVSISWDTVTALISTHSEGGLTEADFELARRIDALAEA
jgi:4a-hydroxytetrahydrobiopterin dehydratase